MPKIAAMIAVIAVIAVAVAGRVGVAQVPLDTELRAAFCIGVFNVAIEFHSKPRPPLYLTPDGRGYTPPDFARRQREYDSREIGDIGDQSLKVRTG
jgi:hypothetical protein